MTRYFRDQKGFTLIEMIIVVIIMGILAAVIIPRISMSTDDAKLSTLKTDLSHMRSSIEIYYAQHNNTYPGLKKTNGTGDATANDTEAATAFVNQLTLYSEASGKTDTDKANLTAPIFGPYIRGNLPANPFDPDEDNDVKCDIADGALGAKVADTGSAWKFFPVTGVLIANADTDHDDL